MIVYIILAAVLIAIAAYYPIKLIKFYSMESEKQIKESRVHLHDYVTFDHEGISTLGMVTDIEEHRKDLMVRILSGTDKGKFHIIKLDAINSKVKPEIAINELIKQKEDWRLQQ